MLSNSSNSHSDVDGWLEKLKVDKKILEEKDLQILCTKVKELLSSESTVQTIKAPVTVCGDIHGQFYELLELFKTGGELPFSNYIFMGDFVNRGYHSVETIEYLLCLKLRYPGQITLLRGNHESRQMTKVYGFYDEILKKFGNSSPWELFMDVFDHFPLAATIEGQILCIHGGLSPDLKSIDEIRTIPRQQEIPTEGIFNDLMWSVPDDVDGWKINPRCGGWLFGAEPTKIFSHANNLQLICRAHSLVVDGYKYWFADKNLVTVWSVPNYCYKMQNAASILAFDENLGREFKFFKESPDNSKLINYNDILPQVL